MSLKIRVREMYDMGYSQREIADALGCSKSNVHHHLHVDARAKSLERQRRSRVSLAESVKSLKEASPCADCGIKYPYYVMDFDHVGGDKTMNVSRLARGAGGKARLLQEISKCDLVCANCHRKRTHLRSTAKTA